MLWDVKAWRATHTTTENGFNDMQESMVRGYTRCSSNIEGRKEQVVDARAQAGLQGAKPAEAAASSGHMPGSVRIALYPGAS